MIPDILATRYATPALQNIFSEEAKIIQERELWIAVMKAQRELGIDIPAEAIERYEGVKDVISLEHIKEREKIKKHDVDARVEEFNDIAGYQYAHQGMTSRDATDNVEQVQIKQALTIIRNKFISILRHFNEKTIGYMNIALTARTHHQPAEPTLLGRRISMWQEELLYHLPALDQFLENYPLRGIKGPVGTQRAMLKLLGSEEKVATLEQKVAQTLGFSKLLHSPGQVYPRSLDLSLINRITEAGAACSNYALGMRLMAGYELVTEGFKPGQVGSSIMPHKMNTSKSERIWSLYQVIKMLQNGASRLAGETWEEGDVSCSVMRRVILPQTFYAADGLCETTLNVLNDMGAYPVVIQKEMERYLPFLATTELLSLAIARGIPRPEAHAVIKKHTQHQALLMREEGTTPNLRELADDKLFSGIISHDDIEEILERQKTSVGNAREQAASVIQQTCLYIGQNVNYREAANYEPQPIL